MSSDESDMIIDMIEYGWLHVDKINKVTCWNDGITYTAEITFKEVKDE
jgi:hypothetical protein